MYEVIVNPAARNGQARQIGEEAERYLKEKQVDFVIRYTEYPGTRHGVGAGRRQPRGGNGDRHGWEDGTVCETAAGLVHTNTSLGIAPAGTGNDFIKTIGTPRELERSVGLHPHASRAARQYRRGKRPLFSERVRRRLRCADPDLRAGSQKAREGHLALPVRRTSRAIRTFKPFKMHIQVGDESDVG